MAETNLKVQGMTCINCVTKVEEALKSLEGVSHVDVNQNKGLAKVTYDDSVTAVEDLIRAIVNVGFRAEVKRGLFG